MENLAYPHCKKMTNLVLEKNSNGVAEQPFDKKIMGETHGLNQPFQQQPGIEMR